MSQDSLATQLSTDQSKPIEDAQQSIKLHAYHMKQHLNVSHIKEAIKYCQLILNELRYGYSPKEYYVLYNVVFDHLQQFQMGLLSEPSLNLSTTESTKEETTAETEKEVEEAETNEEGEHTDQNENPNIKNTLEKKEHQQRNRKNNPLEHLYELVQYTPSILPRLYLMITIGCVYAQKKPDLSRDILFDLLEMCKGIQHPLRGLFLRYYLQQMSKKILDHLQLELGLGDKLEFLLGNFVEMNKLWVRMQYQGPLKDRHKREQERKDLKLLVGLNLVRLSQLEGLNKNIYKQNVLPRILEQVVQCRDVISQEYLMEALSQVFTDEFHLYTLEELLECIAELNQGVSITFILSAFIERLSGYAKRVANEQEEGGSGEIPGDLFDIFWKRISVVIKEREELSTEDVVSLLLSMIKLALSCYPNRLDYLSTIYQFTGEYLDSLSKQQQQVLCQMPTQRYLLEILTMPIQHHQSLFFVLEHEGCGLYLGQVVQKVPQVLRGQMSQWVCRHLIQSQEWITVQKYMNALLSIYLSPFLIKHKPHSHSIGSSSSSDSDSDEEVVKEEGGLVSKVIQLVKNEEEPEEWFLMMQSLRKSILESGKRVVYMMPSFIFQFIQLCLCNNNTSTSTKGSSKSTSTSRGTLSSNKLLKYLHHSIEQLVHYNPPLALRLFLHPLQIESLFKPQDESLYYEYLVSAFTIYEDHISTTQEQLEALDCLINALSRVVWMKGRVLGVEAMDVFRGKVAGYCSRLMKKVDQVRWVCKCSILFWGRDFSEGDLLEGGVTEGVSEVTGGGVQGVTGVTEGSQQWAVDEELISAANPWAVTTTTTTTTTTTPPLTTDNADKYQYRDPKRILECLRKALKIADACLDTLQNNELFIDILNWYIYWFQNRCESVNGKYIDGLVDLVFGNLSGLRQDSVLPTGGTEGSVVEEEGDELGGSSKRDNSNPLIRIEVYFLETLKHIEYLARTDQRFGEIHFREALKQVQAWHS